MKRIDRTLFIHDKNEAQVDAIYQLVKLLFKLDVIYYSQVVDARPLNFMMGAT